MSKTPSIFLGVPPDTRSGEWVGELVDLPDTRSGEWVGELVDPPDTRSGETKTAVKEGWIII